MIETNSDERACREVQARLDFYIDNELLTETNLEMTRALRTLSGAVPVKPETRRELRARAADGRAPDGGSGGPGAAGPGADPGVARGRTRGAVAPDGDRGGGPGVCRLVDHVSARWRLCRDSPAMSADPPQSASGIICIAR